MNKIRTRSFIPIYLIVCTPVLVPGYAAAPASASPTGDACRKELCASAVAACMRTDLSRNPRAGTETEKKSFCETYFDGCMRQYVPADVPWYSPETVARFLKCPP
jgi:hypothetical protein